MQFRYRQHYNKAGPNPALFQGGEQMAEEVKVARNFVCAGNRTGTDGKAYVVIYCLKADNTLEETRRTFKFARGFPTIVGGIYTGAMFAGTVIYGLKEARYTGKWDVDPTQVAAWQAANFEHETEIASARLKKKHTDDVAEMLMPLRRMLHGMRKRGMHSEAHAFVNMIMAEMYRPLKKDELE